MNQNDLLRKFFEILIEDYDIEEICEYANITKDDLIENGLIEEEIPFTDYTSDYDDDGSIWWSEED